MPFYLKAACGCHVGKVRKNNEDNFFFDGRCLEEVNRGLKEVVTMSAVLRKELCLAVFDGMGGENFGETASYAAAACLRDSTKRLRDYVIPARQFLNESSQIINRAVVQKAKDLYTERMGSTMVELYFTWRSVYVCNVGDSRAYRLRNGELLQISEDHVEKRRDKSTRKAPLTQYLGLDPEEYRLEPYIAKGDLKKGDQYLLCSDGLTDMLTNIDISVAMSEECSVEQKVKNLIETALDRGGRDNITVIVISIDETVPLLGLKQF